MGVKSKPLMGMAVGNTVENELVADSIRRRLCLLCRNGIPVLASYDPSILDRLEYLPSYLPISLASIDAQIRSVASGLVSQNSNDTGDRCGTNQEQLLEYLEYLAKLERPFASYD